MSVSISQTTSSSATVSPTAEKTVKGYLLEMLPVATKSLSAGVTRPLSYRVRRKYANGKKEKKNGGGPGSTDYHGGGGGNGDFYKVFKLKK